MINAPLTGRRAPQSERAGACEQIFQGVKRQDWRVPDSARQLGMKLARRGEIAYWPAAEIRQGVEQRRDRREPLRLRSAKLLDGAYRFLSECRICDQSPDGLRLALSRGTALPPELAVYFDDTGTVRSAKLVWRQGRMLGLRLQEAAPPGALRPSDRRALGERYYAVPD